MKKYLTAKQVAENLGLNEKTVRQMAQRGEIEAIRLAGPRSPMRITEEAMTKWERSRRKASA